MKIPKYKNITDFAISRHKDYCPYISECKKAELDYVNVVFDTRYNINHLNNWLAERVPVPKKILNHWRKELLFNCEIDKKIINMLAL